MRKLTFVLVMLAIFMATASANDVTLIIKIRQAELESAGLPHDNTGKEQLNSVFIPIIRDYLKSQTNIRNDMNWRNSLPALPPQVEISSAAVTAE